MLRGVTFSGASGATASRGGAWADVHLPPGTRAGSEASLLDRTAIDQALAAAGDSLGIVGLKVSCPVGASLTQRVQIIEASATAVWGVRG